MKGAILAVVFLFVNAELKPSVSEVPHANASAASESSVHRVSPEEVGKLLSPMSGKYHKAIHECYEKKCGLKKGSQYDREQELVNMRKGNVSVLCIDKCVLTAYEDFISAVQSTIEELNLHLWMLKRSYDTVKAVFEYHKRLDAVEQLRQSHQSNFGKPLEWNR